MNRIAVTFISLAMMAITTIGRAQTVFGTPDASVRFISRSGDVLQSFECDDDATLVRVREAVQEQLASPDRKLTSVRIRSTASPDGNTDENRALSDQRADDTRILFLNWIPELERVPFVVTSAGEDYDTLLALLETSDIPGADRAADIIRNVPTWVMDDSGNVVDSRKKQLMDLRGGQTWIAMRETIFPQLRRTRVDFVWDGDSPAKPENEEMAVGEIRIHFPLGDATIRPNYRNNADALAQLRSLMEHRSYMAGDIVRVVGLASPDGAERVNDALARRRAVAIRKYIASHWPEFADAVSVTVEGEAWEDFHAAVQTDAQLSETDRSRILDIIDSAGYE